MMESIARGAAVALLLVATPALADGDAIVGVWKTAPSKNGFAHVEIQRQGSRYFGEITWTDEPNYAPDDPEGMGGQPKIDRNNPDADLRNRPIVGLRIMTDFEYVGQNQWKRGTIYDPESGKTYKCNMKLLEDGTLKVRGYVGISLLGRSTLWTRRDPE